MLFLAKVPEPSLNSVAKSWKLPWFWNVTVFSISLTLERAVIHKSAQAWSSRMTLKILFYYHLCLSDSMACNTAVRRYTCSSIPLCSSNSTWQMQRTRKKIKGSSKAKNMCSSQPWGLISVASSHLSFLQGPCAIPCAGTAGTGFQAKGEESWVILEQGFCMLFFKH